jgi:hypothetical protein
MTALGLSLPINLTNNFSFFDLSSSNPKLHLPLPNSQKICKTPVAPKNGIVVVLEINNFFDSKNAPSSSFTFL